MSQNRYVELKAEVANTLGALLEDDWPPYKGLTVHREQFQQFMSDPSLANILPRYLDSVVHEVATQSAVDLWAEEHLPDTHRNQNPAISRFNAVRSGLQAAQAVALLYRGMAKVDDVEKLVDQMRGLSGRYAVDKLGEDFKFTRRVEGMIEAKCQGGWANEGFAQAVGLGQFGLDAAREARLHD